VAHEEDLLLLHRQHKTVLSAQVSDGVITSCQC
jgi:hypothetical protein